MSCKTWPRAQIATLRCAGFYDGGAQATHLAERRASECESCEAAWRHSTMETSRASLGPTYGIEDVYFVQSTPNMKSDYFEVTRRKFQEGQPLSLTAHGDGHRGQDGLPHAVGHASQGPYCRSVTTGYGSAREGDVLQGESPLHWDCRRPRYERLDLVDEVRAPETSDGLFSKFVLNNLGRDDLAPTTTAAPCAWTT